MTTAAKKEMEEHHVRQLVNGMLDYVGLKSDEKPDFWIRRNQPPDIAVEVVEYHPRITGTPGDLMQVKLAAHWHNDLAPILEKTRQAKPAVRDLHVMIHFKDILLPSRKEFATFVAEFISMLEKVASTLALSSAEGDIVFIPKDELNAAKFFPKRFIVLATEDWPLSSSLLTHIGVVSAPGLRGIQWQCLNASWKWVHPKVQEFIEIIRIKSEKAKSYTIGNSPLWLLVVCDSMPDVASHVHPIIGEDVDSFTANLKDGGLDFNATPFEEIYLLSAFSGSRLRLFQRTVHVQ